MLNTQSITIYIKDVLENDTDRAYTKKQAKRVIKEIESLDTHNKCVLISFKGVIVTREFLTELVEYVYDNRGINLNFTDFDKNQNILINEATKIYLDNKFTTRNTKTITPKLISLKAKQSNKFLNNYEATYEIDSKHTKVYELVSRNKELTPKYFGAGARAVGPDGIGIIAFNEGATKILLQKEFRMACGEWVYNFPGGLVDKGETPREAAKRELKEETGLEIIKTIKVLPQAYTSVGISNELVTTVICLADGKIKPSNSIDEQIEAKWYTKDEIRKLLEEHKPMSLRTQSFLWMWVTDLSL